MNGLNCSTGGFRNASFLRHRMEHGRVPGKPQLLMVKGFVSDNGLGSSRQSSSHVLHEIFCAIHGLKPAIGHTNGTPDAGKIRFYRDSRVFSLIGATQCLRSSSDAQGKQITRSRLRATNPRFNQRIGDLAYLRMELQRCRREGTRPRRWLSGNA